MEANDRPGEIAFVLGGGGILGAHEVGMLRALADREISPDLILGTSIGAVNGALFAADPTPAGVARLTRLWQESDLAEISAASVLRRAGTLMRSGTHLESLDAARARLRVAFADRRVEDLAVRFQCVAASIERAAEHWFTEGDLVDVVLASCAVPGILPPVPIDGEHYIDGGIVNSIPVARAVALGAKVIYVLQVGRLEKPLQPPRWPWEVGLVAFEVARRHRFAHDLQSLPEGVRAPRAPDRRLGRAGLQRPDRARSACGGSRGPSPSRSTSPTRRRCAYLEER